MGNYVKVANVGEFQDGGKKKVTAGGKEILLVKTGGAFYAIDNKCPHLGGDLSTGKLEGTVITCPRHGSQFDVKNGHIVRWLNGSGVASVAGLIVESMLPLKTYKVKIENDDILIKV